MKPGEPFNPYRQFLNAWIPHQVLQRVPISHCAKLLYGRLRSYAGRDGQAWPTPARLAADLGVSVRTVYRRLAELKKAGLTRDHPAGRGVEFLWITELEPVQMSLGQVTEMARICDKSGTASLEEVQEEVQGGTAVVENAQGAPVEIPPIAPEDDPGSPGSPGPDAIPEPGQTMAADDKTPAVRAQLSHKAPDGPELKVTIPPGAAAALERSLDPGFTRQISSQLQNLALKNRIGRPIRKRVNP